MHARPQVREILVGKKMQRWVLIAKHPCSIPVAQRGGTEELPASLRPIPLIMAKLGLNSFRRFR
jgi:hypothetical protein